MGEYSGTCRSDSLSAWVYFITISRAATLSIDPLAQSNVQLDSQRNFGAAFAAQLSSSLSVLRYHGGFMRVTLIVIAVAALSAGIQSAYSYSVAPSLSTYTLQMADLPST